MAKGNPNPSPNTRIGAPGGPPPGKTVGQRSLEMQNAEAAMRIRSRLLKAVEEKLDTSEGEAVLAMVEAAMLKLLTDSETRGLGAPTQKIGGVDGGPVVFAIRDMTKDA